MDQPDYAALLREVADRQDALEAHLAGTAPEHAPLFNLFDFLDRSELGLSALIRWLLDPQGSHAQGDAFLQAFLHFFGIEAGGKTALARSRCEVATHAIEASRRRIDIQVDIEGFILAIENKPFARWQPQQVKAYLRQLRSTARTGFCLVLLKSAEGDVPEEQLPAQMAADLKRDRALIDSHYGKLAEWARGCSDLCRAERVRFLLQDMAKFIEREFGGGMTETARQLVADVVAETPGGLGAALGVLGAREEILRPIHERLTDAVRAKAGPAGFTVERYEGGRDMGFGANQWAIEVTTDSNFWFYFICDWTKGHVPWIGLWRESSSYYLAQYVVADIEKALGPGVQEGSWAWWRRLDDGQLGVAANGNFAQLWSRFADPEPMAERIIDWASLAFNALGVKRPLRRKPASAMATAD